jgi:hypothetical protein
MFSRSQGSEVAISLGGEAEPADVTRWISSTALEARPPAAAPHPR